MDPEDLEALRYRPQPQYLMVSYLKGPTLLMSSMLPCHLEEPLARCDSPVEEPLG